MAQLNELRTMPHSLEAEMSVLGSVLVDPECINLVAEKLRMEDFYHRDHRAVYGAMLSLFNSGKPIDLIQLIEQLKLEGAYDAIGGKAYLMQLIDWVPTASRVEEYAAIVSDKANLRSLITASSEIEEICLAGNEEPRTVMDLAEQKIYGVLQGRTHTSFSTVKEVILGEFDRLQELAQKGSFQGIATGFRDLDRVLTGLNPGNLYLIAARPGMGKTAFALNIAQNIAKLPSQTVAIFSLEMSKEQLVSRLLSSEAMISTYQLRTGELSEEDWVNLSRAAGVLSAANILLDDTAGINVLEMKAKCRRVKGLSLVIVDYLQLMQGATRSENRVQEVSAISRALKIMAKELGVPVLCLSQLSRGPESRTDKRPMLSDLRESGAIEQDADVVVFLYRDEVYNPDTEQRNLAECIIAKNRHGATNKVYLQWLGEFTRFSTQERAHHEG